MLLPWQEHHAGMALPIRVTPKAGRNEIAGLHEGRLGVRVTAVPEDGKANAAVLKLLGKALGIAPSRLDIISGAQSRDKLVLLRDAKADDVPPVLRSSC